MYKLPRESRPNNGGYCKQLVPGIDLPRWFFDDIKAIDENFHFVWHTFTFHYEDIINQYSGTREDPRLNIREEGGLEIWGWVMKNPDGTPRQEHLWHLWRLCHDRGYAHVAPLLSTQPEYLSLLVRRLHLQARFIDQFGPKAWSRHLSKEQEDERKVEQKRKKELFGSVQEENSWLTKQAMENMNRGVTKPTNPTKDIIMSYPGQTNRSRIVRPLSDEEGGLHLPDEFSQ